MLGPRGNNVLGAKQTKSRRLIGIAITLTWIGVVCGIAFLGYAMHEANEIAIRKQQTLLENGLKVSREDMYTNLRSITIWDEAVEKINNDPDHDFINNNVGAWFADYIKFPISMVLNAKNEVLYYYADGSEQEAPKAAKWRAAIMPLLKEVRKAEAADNYALLKKGDAYEPRAAVDFVRAGDVVALVGLSSVVPDFSTVMPKPGPSVLVVTILPVTNGLLQSIARDTLIRSVHYSPVAPTDDTPFIEIRPGSGSEEGYVSWKPDLPGQSILAAVWGPSLVILAVLILASVVTYRTASNLSDRMIASEARAIHTARHDALTGLANRNWFLQRLKTEVAEASPGHVAALLFLDLDNFKEVNDSMGHTAGDEMLVEVGERLQRLVSDLGFVARHSSDEFAIYLKDASPQQIESFGNELRTVLEQPYELIGTTTHVTASIGVAIIEGPKSDISEVTRCADLALNKAKTVRRGTIVYFSDELDSTIQMRSQLARDMRASLDSNDFHLLYQPLINANNMQVAGVESLIRWTHPSRGPISPGIFIPIAEGAGLIRDISIWVMHNAFEDSKNWINLTLSINISPIHMKHPEFINDVKIALEETGANPRRIGLEITEGVLLEHTDHMRRQLAQLRQLGFKIVLDDFGTGYSSLDYLHRYNFDRIKIDKSFIQGLDWVMQAPAIVQAVIALSHMSGADVVAEGVETTQQYEFLKEAGCDLIQGYYFFEPLPKDDISELTQTKASRDVA